MPDTQLTNPTGNNGEGVWGTAQVIEEYLFDPTVTTSTTGYANGLGLVNGTVVFIYGGYTYSTNTTSATVVSTGSFGSPGAVPVIRKSPIAGAVNTQIGVVINAPTGTTTGAGASTTGRNDMLSNGDIGRMLTRGAGVGCTNTGSVGPAI